MLWLIKAFIVTFTCIADHMVCNLKIPNNFIADYFGKMPLENFLCEMIYHI